MKAIRLVLWALIAALAVALGWFTYEWQKTENQIAAKPYGVPFELVDQSGNPITQAAFVGRPTALFFGFTHCPEVCPTTLFELDGWLKQVDPDGDRIGAYFITVDPERDSPELLGNYVSGVTDRVIGISGPPEKVAQVIKGFNIYAKKVPVDTQDPDGDYTMDHTASVFLLDAKGRFKSTIAWGENPDTAIAKLENLL
ncbi:MAG: SCO family protein [Hoeflea sp.]|uniref:SCO family protein n=1 Tax=Hoeflea sp. TaxID=1940281 RepID=UPI003297BF24|tara:strand:+ start:6255 stop:6848 length:594 start_codon:yes stop_codon:yes gene_type:complete